MTFNRTKRVESSAGFTLVELLIGVSIFAVLALAGLPHVDRRREDLNTSVQRVVADMRFARSRSITSGEHYAVKWTGAHAYEVQRLFMNSAGEWELDRVERTVLLPDYISFSLGESEGAGGVDLLEFNTRGMLISSPEPLWPVMSDLLHDVERTFSVWPSGQIYMEG